MERHRPPDQKQSLLPGLSSWEVKLAFSWSFLSGWGLKKLHRIAAREERDERDGGGHFSISSLSDLNIWKATQMPNTIESGDNPMTDDKTASKSETIEFPKTEEEMGATKSERENESKNASSQQSTSVHSVKENETSTEELLKILEDGNLSEVKEFSGRKRTTFKCLSYTGRCSGTQRCS